MDNQAKIDAWMTLTEARLRALIIESGIGEHVKNEIMRALLNSPVPSGLATTDIITNILDTILEELKDGSLEEAVLDTPREMDKDTMVDLSRRFIQDTHVTAETSEGDMRQKVEHWVQSHAKELPWYEDYKLDYITHVFFTATALLDQEKDRPECQ